MAVAAAAAAAAIVNRHPNVSRSGGCEKSNATGLYNNTTKQRSHLSVAVLLSSSVLASSSTSLFRLYCRSWLSFTGRVLGALAYLPALLPPIMASLLQRSLRVPLLQSHLTPSPSSVHLTVVRGFRRDQGRIEVILNEDIRGLGFKDDIVQVRRGYARNILVPRNRALYATNDNRRARNLAPVQLQRPPAALRQTATDATSSAAATTTTASSAATNHTRRYLTELATHIARLPLIFQRQLIPGSPNLFQGQPITATTLYRHLIYKHKTYFLHASDVTLMPPHAVGSGRPVQALGDYEAEVRVRAVEVTGEGSGLGGVGERVEVVRVVVRVVKQSVADELKRLEKAEAAAEKAEAEQSGAGEDGAAGGQRSQTSAKGRERAGVSKMRA